MKREFRRTKNKKFHLKVFELYRKLAFLEYFKNKIQDRLDIENQKKIKYARKYMQEENRMQKIR